MKVAHGITPDVHGQFPLTAVPAHADAQEKKSPVVVTAIARELVDFIWAIAQAVPVARKTRRRSPLSCAAQADALVRLPAAALPRFVVERAERPPPVQRRFPDGLSVRTPKRSDGLHHLGAPGAVDGNGVQFGPRVPADVRDRRLPVRKPIAVARLSLSSARRRAAASTLLRRCRHDRTAPCNTPALPAKPRAFPCKIGWQESCMPLRSNAD